LKNWLKKRSDINTLKGEFSATRLKIRRARTMVMAGNAKSSVIIEQQ
jgi:hypothetical protein